jgi:hypothetical protein
MNWTIQKAFPLARITLFVDPIHVPCTVFLSDKDALVPAEKVEYYFRSNGVSMGNAESVNQEFFDESGDSSMPVSSKVSITGLS